MTFHISHSHPHLLLHHVSSFFFFFSSSSSSSSRFIFFITFAPSSTLIFFITFHISTLIFFIAFHISSTPSSSCANWSSRGDLLVGLQSSLRHLSGVTTATQDHKTVVRSGLVHLDPIVISVIALCFCPLRIFGKSSRIVTHNNMQGLRGCEHVHLISNNSSVPLEKSERMAIPYIREHTRLKDGIMGKDISNMTGKKFGFV
ncbi:hypothetical protein Sjap_019496 [Stephania japonica]|uniref:Uncharacterized protein n=1 Tax=Stephania japonica TaxID=461633 RepID=A0AAP0F4D4_9MAGN